MKIGLWVLHILVFLMSAPWAEVHKPICFEAVKNLTQMPTPMSRSLWSENKDFVRPVPGVDSQAAIAALVFQTTEGPVHYNRLEKLDELLGQKTLYNRDELVFPLVKANEIQCDYILAKYFGSFKGPSQAFVWEHFKTLSSISDAAVRDLANSAANSETYLAWQLKKRYSGSFLTKDIFRF